MRAHYETCAPISGITRGGNAPETSFGFDLLVQFGYVPADEMLNTFMIIEGAEHGGNKRLKRCIFVPFARPYGHSAGKLIEDCA